MSQPPLPLNVGDVLHINEPDYLYGTGPLLLRVTKVGAVQQLGGNAWIELDGLVLAADGTPLSQQLRHAVVRLSALRYGLRTPGE
jgi:hypothetical protein